MDPQHKERTFSTEVALYTMGFCVFYVTQQLIEIACLGSFFAAEVRRQVFFLRALFYVIPRISRPRITES